MKTQASDPQDRVASIHQLDAKIRKWWARVPQNLQITPDNLSSFSPLDLPKVVLVNVVYYQCLCALHSSIVPLFSWGQDIPDQGLAKQLSAQVAYENACAISRLLDMVLAGEAETSGFPSFTGYAAYCSYAVQLPFTWCSDIAVRDAARHNTATNLRMIRGLGRHWKAIAILVS